MLYDRKGNLHIHTTLSDGSGSFDEVRQAARRAGLAWIIVTDHNARAAAEEGWADGLLTLVGQELHDPEHPHQNHLLILRADQDLAPLAGDTAGAIAAAHRAGGLCLLAHPFEHSGAYADEPEINWVNWELASQADGIELWNYMSEFKAHLPNAPLALLYALWPRLAMRGPYPETMAYWDERLQQGPCLGVGGSDAHAGTYSLGPIHRQVFGYAHLFRSVNTHVLLDRDWTGSASDDVALLLDALRAGRCYVAYDGLAEGTGFCCVLHDAQGNEYPMGSVAPLASGVELSARTPKHCRLRLWRDGQAIAEEMGMALSRMIDQPGVYRVTAHRRYAGRWRTWLIGNPFRVVAD